MISRRYWEGDGVKEILGVREFLGDNGRVRVYRRYKKGEGILEILGGSDLRNIERKWVSRRNWEGESIWRYWEGEGI